MKVIKCADNTIRIKIEDTDSYEVTDDNGVNFWPTQKQVATIIRAPTDEQCRICSKATERKAREDALNEFMKAIEYRFEDTNNGRGVVGTIRGLKKSLRAQQAGEP